MTNIVVPRRQLGQGHCAGRVKIDEALRRYQREMRRYEADEQHPAALVTACATQPRHRRVADRLVVGVVARVAGADLAKSHYVVPGSRNRVAHRSPHLSDTFGEMHGMVLAVEAGRIAAIAVVQLADGFDPDVRGLQALTPTRHAAVVAHRVVPVADVVDVAPGRETCTSRDADGTGRVSRREAGAACGESVDIWRSDDRMAGARQGARLVFVGNDEDEIFCFHGSGACG